MKRDISKAIEDYKKQFYDKNIGALWLSDYIQIKEVSNNDYWDSIANAMMAGFMIGYRTAQRQKKANKSK